MLTAIAASGSSGGGIQLCDCTMKNLFRWAGTWFYCLPIPDIIFLACVAVLIFLILKNKYSAHGWWIPGMLTAFALSFAAAVISTLFRQPGDTPAEPTLIPFFSYWTVLSGGNVELIRSNFMNCALFFPAGLFAAAFLPSSWSRRARLLLAVGILTTVSIGIEYLQFAYALGNPETDDVIHNALGALLGSFFGTASLPKIAEQK